jgi:hypothetical protein
MRFARHRCFCSCFEWAIVAGLATDRDASQFAGWVTQPETSTTPVITG